MASQTITGNHASFSITVDSYTLTNLGTVGSNTVATGLTVSGTADTVVNAGTLSGESYAVAASQGLSLTNQTGGRISGDTAIDIYGAPGSVTNAGVITGVFQGVALGAGGYVNNQSGGAITGTGVYGIQIRGGAGTVTNAGSISGGTDAVRLAAGYANRLVVDPGARFTGTVSGGNTIGATAISTLELASGAATGTLSGLGTQFINFANVTIDSGATWAVNGSVGASVTLINSGTLAASLALGAGAILTNASGGAIGEAGAGYAVTGVGAGPATVVNAGGNHRHVRHRPGCRRCRHQPERWHDRRDLRTGHRSGRFRHRGQRWQHFRPLRRRPV